MGGWTMKTMFSRWLGVMVGTAVASAARLGAPSEADACGGTFCDAGPQVMPVDQTGENVLFVMGDGRVEAHVQIQYTGNPEQFAWIVPVMGLPEVSVGSDLLFQEALASTVPTFTLNQRTECDNDDEPEFGCAASDDFAAAGDDGFGGGLEGGEFDDDPQVVVRDVVGSFEYVVLEGGTAEGVVAWLDDNGFAQDDEAPPILSEYHADGFMFVAFKLRPGAGVDEIHPVVLDYPGNEPCVPLRLTRIAAKEDMGVRVFFLGDDRVVPTNFRHVQINPLKIDWLGLGANYEEVVTLAVDEEGADGHGFVTEYAGSSNVIDRSRVYSPSWKSGPFAYATPENLSNTLEAQGLLGGCDFDFNGNPICDPIPPLVMPLLQNHFPPPPGVSPEDFYSCTDCYADSTETLDWNPEGFIEDFEEQILAPAEHARDILTFNSYLTRMYTTISPAEMTEDPLFEQAAGLGDVSNQWSATRVNVCDGPDRLELTDGAIIWFDGDDIPPSFDEMPSSVAAEEIMEGTALRVADRQGEINAMLDDWNDSHAPDLGCGCTTPKRMRGSGVLAMLLLLGLRARRRRRRRRA